MPSPCHCGPWGSTSGAGATRPSGRGATPATRILRQRYPAIEARAHTEGGEIHWGDETGVAADEHPGTGYAREGEAAVAAVPDSHIRVNMISAVTNADEPGLLRVVLYGPIPIDGDGVLLDLKFTVIGEPGSSWLEALFSRDVYRPQETRLGFFRAV